MSSLALPCPSRPPNQPLRRPLHLLALLLAVLLGWVLTPAARAGLPEVVAAAKPAVVAVGTYSEVANPRFGFRGTGFVVGNGLMLITNAHVLPPPGTTPEPQLVLHVPGSRVNNEGHGDTRTLSIVAMDRAHDLVLLRFGGSPLPTLKLAADGSAREGQAIALIGFPIGSVLGFSHVTHSGIISSITPIVLPPANARQLDAAAVARMRAGVFDILQLDAIAYPGNSGGPLLDIATGEVLGVLNMVVVKSTRESALSDPTGISYALPVRYVHALLDRR
jgi:S1-C subfamily serine protease